jgi:uncharacterized repeat protein (TIGR03837 family)
VPFLRRDNQPMLWDVFCKVVDNFGDIGVCWRLAADLASRGEQVRLRVDDASALGWMAPAGAPGVEVLHGHADPSALLLGDVVIEAFGCDLPAPFVRRMAASRCPPVWINLEYLSAQPYVERSHGLPSPQATGPGAGLRKWFFYPGFSARTGGLLREPGLIERLARLDGRQWLAEQGLAASAEERVVSLFCYANAAVPTLLDALAGEPTLLIATAGEAAAQTAARLGPAMRHGRLRAAVLPRVAQHEYDLLLRACDMNLVRGEDSFVRAQWAGKPFIWQIYPQQDGAHAAKLGAFLDLFLASASPRLAVALRHTWGAWNGLAQASDTLELPPGEPWRAQVEAWRDGLLVQPDLTTDLMGFASERR